MKKKISLLGLILILVLSFTGCGKSETTEYDQATLEQYAEFVVQNFEAMTTEQLDSFSDMRDLQLDTQLMNAGLPVDGGLPYNDQLLGSSRRRVWCLC